MAVVGFTGISVFGAEQTEGEPLDYEIDRTQRQLPPLADVAARLGVTVKWQSVPEDRLGGYNPLDDGQVRYLEPRRRGGYAGRRNSVLWRLDCPARRWIPATTARAAMPRTSHPTGMRRIG